MEYIFFSFYLIVWFIVFAFVLIMTDVFSHWTNRKGYPNPGWKFLVTLPIWLGVFGLTAFFLYGGYRIINYGYTLTAVSYLGLYLWFFVPALGGIAISSLILKLLPKRKFRIAGPRRIKIPYLGIGYAVGIFGGVMVVFSLWLQADLAETLEIVMAAAALSGSMFYLDRRVKSPSVQDAIARDLRPPLLYLRSFDQEGNRFAEVSQTEAAKYSEITSYAGNAAIYHLTLEQFFAREINRSIGPFVALGNPEDYLPPEGAYRSYATDTKWQDFFRDLSNQSAAILMQMGNSDNLNWELVSIRERGLQEKLFIVTPPPKSKISKYSIAGFSLQLTDRIKGIQPASWDRFAINLSKTGYHPPEEDPGPGVVVTFDESCQSMTLASGVKTPLEYIQAIQGRLAALLEK